MKSSLRWVVSVFVLATVTAWAVDQKPGPGVDHSQLDALLKRYVDDDGMVDYRGWKAKDEKTLRRYLTAMGAVDPRRLDSKKKLAYWINVYNALTLQAMLEFYPIKSIKDKVSRLGGYNVWDDYTVSIKKESYSLNAIEHKILRKLSEPRIHFAIVCASISCPRLRNEAYVADKIHAQLDDQAKDFFSRSRNFQIDAKKEVVRLSSILKWFAQDFGADDAARMAFVRRYLSREQLNALPQGKIKTSYLKYNWLLNEQVRR